MSNYMTLRWVTDRIKFGTNVTITEEFTGKEIFNGLWAHDKNDRKLDSEVSNAEVTTFTVIENRLCIEVVRTRQHNT